MPPYGLDESFTGMRWVSSWERPDSAEGPLTMLELGHGDPRGRVAGDGAVEVGVRRRDRQIDIFDTLTTALALGLYSAGLGMSVETWLNRTEQEGFEVRPWPAVGLSVDGRVEEFALWQLAGHWVALRTLPDAWLYVHSLGRAVVDTALTRHVDLEAYVDGSALLGNDLRSS